MICSVLVDEADPPERSPGDYLHVSGVWRGAVEAARTEVRGAPHDLAERRVLAHFQSAQVRQEEVPESLPARLLLHDFENRRDRLPPRSFGSSSGN